MYKLLKNKDFLKNKDLEYNMPRGLLKNMDLELLKNKDLEYNMLTSSNCLDDVLYGYV